MIKGSGNKNAIQERHTIVVGDNAVVVTGFYEFTRMQEGKPVPGPSRFTMLITKSDGEWHIARHHSSTHVQPKKECSQGSRNGSVGPPVGAEAT